MGWTRSRVSGATRVVEVRDGELDELHVTPERAGPRARAGDGAVGAGTPEQNAEIARAVLGRRAAAPSARWCVLNAGAAIYVGGRADSIADGRASWPRQAIDSGAAPRRARALRREHGAGAA